MTTSTSSNLSFRLLSSPHHLGARLGQLTLSRHPSDPSTSIPTPNIWTATSRGVVPHLSRDHVDKMRVICGLHVPFESYLENSPPVPILQPGANPLHTFLGFRKGKRILSFGLRDPNDAQHMHANGNDHVVAQCVRGAKKVTPAMYASFALKLQPDIIFSLPDIPYTSAPYSQKRQTKSVDRTLRWLGELLIATTQDSFQPLPPVFVHLLGGSVSAAREALSDSLLEPLEGKLATSLPHLNTLDEGVSGYVLDLVPIQLSANSTTPSTIGLLNASLERLTQSKPRILTGLSSPHQILEHVLHCGIDLFDSAWAQRAADWGVALDFTFPVPAKNLEGVNAKTQVGMNLYDEKYAMDFGGLRTTFGDEENLERCPCIACTPIYNPDPIVHHVLDEPAPIQQTSDIPHTSRAYIHHLLHTHEMGSHAMLTSHNLSVLSSFFDGIRNILTDPNRELEEEVQRFGRVYADPVDVSEKGVLEAGRKRWEEVDLARGKGRMKREKEEKDRAIGHEA